MHFVVLGKGKTGSLVTEAALGRQHQVTTAGSKENEEGAALRPERLQGVDAVIDFTTPEAVIHNITACARAKTNMVVGTTGWYQHLGKVRELVELSGIG